MAAASEGCCAPINSAQPQGRALENQADLVGAFVQAEGAVDHMAMTYNRPFYGNIEKENAPSTNWAQ
eukprot:6201280-Pleurochrysis_carterae.AAC.3